MTCSLFESLDVNERVVSHDGAIYTFPTHHCAILDFELSKVIRNLFNLFDWVVAILKNGIVLS